MVIFLSRGGLSFNLNDLIVKPSIQLIKTRLLILPIPRQIQPMKFIFEFFQLMALFSFSLVLFLYFFHFLIENILHQTLKLTIHELSICPLTLSQTCNDFFCFLGLNGKLLLVELIHILMLLVLLVVVIDNLSQRGYFFD